MKLDELWFKKPATMELETHKDTKEPLNHTEIAIAGATSGLITRAISQPLDVLKIRFQLQVEPITTSHKSSKYKSMAQAVSTIYKEEGILAFWKGHVPAQILSITFGISQFWTFHFLSDIAKRHDFYGYKSTSNFICGAIAGASSGIITFPFDLLRTRLVAQDEKKKIYKSMFSAYRHIISNEGFFALYKGLSPSLLSLMPNAGLQFMFYKFIDRSYKVLVKQEEDSYSMSGSVIAGSISGLLSKLVLYPLDLARKRMQIQGFQKYRTSFGRQFTCGHVLDCSVKVYKNEGFIGLYKGVVPSSAKALLTSGLAFAVFEFVCECIVTLKNR